LVCACALALAACTPGAVAAPLQSVSPYGEAVRIPSEPGPDTKAKFGPLLTETNTLAPGRFVYPVAMAIDTNDESAPEKYAVYVLDLVNPQALSHYGEAPTTTVLQYRLQKLENIGGGSNVVASRMFTLVSTATDPSLHATALAVDGAAHRVYVLFSDAPSVPENGKERETNFAADRIDAWTTGTGSRAGEAPLTPATELSEDKLVRDPSDGAGELVGPDASHHLQTTGASSLDGEIEGESLVVDGTGDNTRLALAGNEYGSAVVVTPTIVAFAVGLKGEEAGAEVARWGGAGKLSDVAATENPTAKSFESSQKSEVVYNASGDADGSITVSLGPDALSVGTLLQADHEPNVANISADLATTTAVLPWENALGDIGKKNKKTDNLDRAATDGFAQDLPFKNGELGPLEAATATLTPLGPSVVALAGSEPQFPNGVYAGLVANRGGGHAPDPQQGSRGVPYSWRTEWTSVNSKEEEVVEAPASLGIRVFDAEGQSLEMIGDTTAGGLCNMQGGPRAGYSGGEGVSFAALAAGREGVVFALVQPDLATSAKNSLEIDPAAPLGVGQGDQVIEFKPDDTTAGQECPQPSEAGFAITNESTHSAPSTGSEPVTALAGAKLEFDASQVNLHGGAPWVYEWDLENGDAEGLINHPWTLLDEFSEPPGAGSWSWPSPVIEHEYKTPGTYTVKLNLVNDFGVVAAERTVIVEPTEPAVARFTVSQPVTAAQPATLDASASTVPAHDSIEDYHWEFDGQQGEDKHVPSTDHTFTTPGSHKITLKITDAFHKKAETSKTVSVGEEAKGPAPPGPAPGGGVPPAGNQGSPPVSQGSSPGSQGPPLGDGAAPSAKARSLTTAQRLANAMKACKRIKPKKRRVACERQAKNRFGAKAKKKSAKTRK